MPSAQARLQPKNHENFPSYTAIYILQLHNGITEGQLVSGNHAVAGHAKARLDSHTFRRAWLTLEL